MVQLYLEHASIIESSIIFSPEEGRYDVFGLGSWQDLPPEECHQVDTSVVDPRSLCRYYPTYIVIVQGPFVKQDETRVMAALEHSNVVIYFLEMTVSML